MSQGQNETDLQMRDINVVSVKYAYLLCINA